MTIHYGGEHRGRQLAGSYAPCGKHLFTQRSDMDAYDFDAAPNTADRSEVTCPKCISTLEHDDALHWCSIEGESGAYGAAATECYEDDDGRLWITNGEYATSVLHCPQCGQPAKVKEPR